MRGYSQYIPFKRNQRRFSEEEGLPSMMIEMTPHTEEENLFEKKSEALKNWKEIENIDSFLDQVYKYFYGKGIFVILLTKIFNWM